VQVQRFTQSVMLLYWCEMGIAHYYIQWSPAPGDGLIIHLSVNCPHKDLHQFIGGELHAAIGESINNILWSSVKAFREV